MLKWLKGLFKAAPIPSPTEYDCPQCHGRQIYPPYIRITRVMHPRPIELHIALGPFCAQCLNEWIRKSVPIVKELEKGNAQNGES